MTVKLPGKAGFVPTVQEWDALVRIAENLAAQVVQAQAQAGLDAATIEEMKRERDAALRQPAPATACRVCKGSGRKVSQENLSYPCRWCDGSGKEPADTRSAPAGGEARP